MGQILHPSSHDDSGTTSNDTQNSQESLTAMADRYHINVKTVAKWRKRTTTSDAPMGPRQTHSNVLTVEQEAVIVAIRRRTLLPLDDCLYALQSSIPNLTRSSLHRCLQRAASAGCRTSKAKSPSRINLVNIQTAIFILTSLKRNASHSSVIF